MSEDSISQEGPAKGIVIEPYGDVLAFLQSSALVKEQHGFAQEAARFRAACSVIRLQQREIARLTELELRWRDIVATTTRSKPLGGFIWRWLHDKGVT